MSAKDLNQLLSVIAEGRRMIIVKLLQKISDLEGALAVLGGDSTEEGIQCRKYLLTKIDEYVKEIEKLS